MKTIYLARHAKSSWKFDASDFDRPLNTRGETDAIKMGREMHQLGWLPEVIISSPAVRAKLTCQAYCEIFEYPKSDVQWNEDVYAARMVTLLHCLSGLDESTQSVMLIGHNPALEDLIVHLCGYSQVIKQQQADRKILTTANVAKLTTKTQWKDIVMDEMHLDKILRPKEVQHD